jgi:hypothetical protein
VFRLIFFILIIILFISCIDSKNDKDAYIVKKEDNLFIKLTGKRPLNSHNPEDIIANKTYDDTLLIPIRTLNDGVINGEDIPVKKGHYKYKGKIIIQGKHLNVTLLYDNYDDHRLDPLSWNGNYIIKDKE